jgi:hypothetical protein
VYGRRPITELGAWQLGERQMLLGIKERAEHLIGSAPE